MFLQTVGLLFLTVVRGISLQSLIKFSHDCVPPVVSAVPGFMFGDNGGHKYVTEQNGVAVAVTEVGTDKEGVSLDSGDCFRFKVSSHFAPGFSRSGLVGTT